MLISAFDTETTGIVRDYRSPDAPHLAAITAIIYDTELARIQASFNTMVQLPEGELMPPQAQAVNGLSIEMLDAYGLDLETALATILQLLAPVDLLVGFNTAFDVKMLASALYRSDMIDDIDTILCKETYCTMRESKQLVQAKNIKGHLKNPKLTEAYYHFFGRELDNAHSANADTVATLEIYLALQQHKAAVEAAGGEVKL